MEKQIKKYLKEKYSLEDIFEKSGFKKTLQNVSDSSLKYYGYSPIPIRIGWDSENSDIAWISDKECYINLDSPLDKGLNFLGRKMSAVGKMVHEELGHGLHTDFGRKLELQNSKDNFPYKIFFETYSNYSDIETSYKQNKELFNSIFFNICNIVEDPVVEYLAIKKYPGLKKYIVFLVNLLVRNIQESKQYIDFTEPKSIFDLLLMKARKCFDDEYLKYFPELEAVDCFEDLSKLPCYEDRLQATAKIISIVWKYLAPSFENEEAGKQMQQDIYDFQKNNNIGSQSVSRQSNIIRGEMSKSSNNKENDNKEILSDVFDDLSKEIDKSIDDVVKKIYADSDTKKINSEFDINSMRKFLENKDYENKDIKIKYDFEKDIDLYNSLFTPEHKRIGRTLSKKVSKIFIERRKGNVFYELDEGSMIDIDSYAKGSEKIFMDFSAPTKKPLCAVCIMVDQSESMAGERAMSAMNTAFVLEYFCRKLNIPINIYGHNDQNSIFINQFVDFSEPHNNNTASKLTAILDTNGCNHDGVAIRYGISKLSNRQELNKLLFILSDGKPNSSGYGLTQMIEEMPEINSLCKKKNISIIPIAIGNDIKDLERIYGTIVDGRDLTSLPMAISRILLKKIKKMIK